METSSPVRTESRLRRYLAGVGTGYVRMFVQVATGLWLTPFTLQYLDREQFAIFSLILSLLTWLGLLDMGITAGLRVQAARLAGDRDVHRLNRLASTAFFAQNVIVLLVCLLGVGMAFAFPGFFGVRAELHREVVWVCLLSVLGAALSIGTQTFSALLIAHQQIHIDNLIGLLLVAIRTVLTVVLLLWGWGLYSLAIAHLAAKMVTGLLSIVRTFRLIPGLKIRYRLACWEEMRSTMGLGIWFTLGSLAGIMIDSFDGTITAKLLSVEMVASLALTWKFYELVGSLVVSFTETARPMLGQMLGQNRSDKALHTYRQLFGFSTSLAIVAALAVWSGNGCFVEKWVGRVNYAGPWVDLALALSVVTHMWVMPNRAILSANLALRSQCLVRLLEGTVKLGLAIWFGRQFGLLGIVVATSVSALLTSMWLMPWLTARMFGRRFGQFIWQDASRVVMVLTIMLPLAFLTRSLADGVSGYSGALLGATLTGSAGLLLIWFLVLDKSVKARLPVRSLYDKTFVGPFRFLIGH